MESLTQSRPMLNTGSLAPLPWEGVLTSLPSPPCYPQGNCSLPSTWVTCKYKMLVYNCSNAFLNKKLVIMLELWILEFCQDKNYQPWSSAVLPHPSSKQTASAQAWKCLQCLCLPACPPACLTTGPATWSLSKGVDSGWGPAVLSAESLTTSADSLVVPVCSEAQKSKTAGQSHQGPRLLQLLSSGLFWLPLGFKRAAAALDNISSFKTTRREKGSLSPCLCLLSGK